MQHAYTVEPVLYTDPETGEEKLSYDAPNITSSAVKEAALEYHREHEASYITTDSLGRSKHDLDHIEIDQFGRILNHATGETIETPESRQFLNDPDIQRRDIEAEEWNDFTDNFYNQVGGEEAFDALLEWGSEWIDDEEFIDGFNDAMQNEDIESFLQHYEILVQLYNEELIEQ